MTSGEDRKKLLIIAYCFPPLGGVGTLRTLFLTSHLAKFGWCTHVLTVREGASGQPQDQTLMAKIPPDFKISRTGYWDVTTPLRFMGKFFPSKWIEKLRAGLLPDTYVGWLPFAYQQARRIIAREQIDMIYTVSFPHTAHLVGYLLKRRTGKPWLADFRDEWTQNPFIFYRWTWQRRADVWLEQRVIQAADRIVVTTEPYRDCMQSLLPAGARGKVTVITNGFEPNDFANRT